MAFDGIRPNALIFLHFVLLVLSHSPEICYQNLPFNCTDRIFDTPGESQTCALKNVSTVCSELEFGGDNDYDLGDINFRTYRYNKQQLVFHAFFNLTFTNIKWENAVFRYKLISQSSPITLCREFAVTGPVQPEKELFYDCNRFSEANPNQAGTLEVMMSKGDKRSYKKFVFIVPDSEEQEETVKVATEWKIFSFADVTSTKKTVLHFQKPLKFGSFNYSVTAESDGVNITKTVLESPVVFELSSSKSTKFFVEPIGEQCKEKCKIGSTPTLVTEPVSGANIFLSLIPVVLILGLLAFVIFVFLPTKRKYQLIGVPKQSVLVMYKANHEFHSLLVYELSQFLASRKMDMLLDVEEIPQSDPDPFKWCTNAAKNADVILIVSSPSCCPTRGDGIHGTKVFEVLEREIKNGALKKSCRLVRVLLPYCKIEDFPADMNYTLFRVPQQMTGLVNYVHNLRSSVQNFVLPCSQREGHDLTELNKKIYIAGTYMEGHKPLETDRGSIVSLDLIDETSNDELLMKPVKLEFTDESAVYPNMKEMNLLGEEEEESGSQAKQPQGPLHNLKL